MMNETAIDVGKVIGINGGTLALVNLGQVQAVLSCLLLGATLVWTVLKICQAMQDFNKKK